MEEDYILWLNNFSKSSENLSVPSNALPCFCFPAFSKPFKRWTTSFSYSSSNGKKWVLDSHFLWNLNNVSVPAVRQMFWKWFILILHFELVDAIFWHKFLSGYFVRCMCCLLRLLLLPWCLFSVYLSFFFQTAWHAHHSSCWTGTFGLGFCFSVIYGWWCL